MKYSLFRYMTAQGRINWEYDQVYLAAIDNYTFDATHDSLGDIQLSGGVVVSMALVPGKELDSDGWAKSLPTTLPIVPSGTYDLVLMRPEGADFLPMVHYAGAAVATLNGDLVVRPEDSLFAATGKWFRF